MPRMGNRSGNRAWGARAGGVLAALLAVATVFASAPAGASNQSVTFTLTPVSFGSVVIGTSTTGQSIVTNTTGAPVYFISASPSVKSIGAEFHASMGSCTGALATGASCDLSVVFAPNAKGLRASTLSARFGVKNAKGAIIAAATFTTSLRGRGLPPTFTLSGASAGNVVIGQIGTGQAMITNTSIIPLTLRGYHLVGTAHSDFAITANTCPSPLLPGGTCGIDFTFRPHHLGAASATLQASMLLAGTKASIVVRQATISGSGVLKGTLSPPFELSSLDFGTVTVGTTATGSVVLTNTSLHNETFSKDSIKGDFAGAYAVTGNSCPTPIAPATSCDLTVTYSPAGAVTHNATLVVQVTHVNAKLVTVTSTAQTSLTGRGDNPDFTLSASPFPSTTVGATNDGLVTVTNSSLVPLNYSGVSFQGANQSSWALAGSACVGPIAPSGTCTLNIAFSPRSQGTLSVTLQVQLNLVVRGHVSNVARRTALVGQGVLPTFTVGAPSFVATPMGVAVSALSAVTNTSSVSLSYDGYQLSGTNAADFAVTGSTCSGLLAPGASCDLTVQFTPSIGSPGTESATLKVIENIAGTVPTISTSLSQPISGQES